MNKFRRRDINGVRIRITATQTIHFSVSAAGRRNKRAVFTHISSNGVMWLAAWWVQGFIFLSVGFNVTPTVMCLVFWRWGRLGDTEPDWEQHLQPADWTRPPPALPEPRLGQQPRVGEGGWKGRGERARQTPSPWSDLSPGPSLQMSTDSFFIAKRHICIHVRVCGSERDGVERRTEGSFTNSPGSDTQGWHKGTESYCNRLVLQNHGNNSDFHKKACTFLETHIYNHRALQSCCFAAIRGGFNVHLISLYLCSKRRITAPRWKLS